MHTFYLACETCHSLPEKKSAAWDFKWYNKKSAVIVENPLSLTKIEDIVTTDNPQKQYPVYGHYGTKIAPTYKDAGENKLLHGKKEMAFAKRYLTEQERLTPEKKSQMKRVIHRKVSKKPGLCKQCHKEKAPSIPFGE